MLSSPKKWGAIKLLSELKIVTAAVPYVAASLAFLALPALAQEAVALPNVAETLVEPQPALNKEPVTRSIPKLTPVTLKINDELGSKLSTSLERFKITLVEPVVVDGVEVVPVGATGEGEVVHAKKAGGMGAAGEIVLAARFLDVNGRQLKLRSMNIAAAGKGATNEINTMNAIGAGASVFVPAPIGMVGFFIAGKNIVVPSGTIAMAKTAEDFVLSDFLSSSTTKINPQEAVQVMPPATE